MEKKINEILEIIKNEDVKTQQKLLMECASKIGTKEWQDSVNDLWKRIEKLDEK